MAIAFDTASPTASYSLGTSVTFSHTTTGSDRAILVAGYAAPGVNDWTGVTYNGVSLTQIKATLCPTDRYSYLYLLAGATVASGANNVVATRSATGDYIEAFAASYTGVNGSGQPDSSASDTGTSVTSKSVATTVVASDCWLVGFCKLKNGAVVSAGASTTLRGANTEGQSFMDSNGSVGTGAQSLAITWTGSTSVAMNVLSLAPVAAGGGDTSSFFPFLDRR